MFAIHSSFDFGQLTNALPTDATPNHDASSFVLHSIATHTIA